MDRLEQARQLFLEGLACLARQDLEGAEARFSASLEQLPDRPSTLANRAAVRLRLGRLDEAEADARRATTVDPRHAEAWLNRSLVAVARGDAAEAAAHLSALLAVDPRHGQGWLLLARVHEGQGRLADAAHCYAQALSIRPDDFTARMNLGAVLNDLGRFAEALEAHDQALAIDAGNVDVLSNRGVALAGLGRHGEALAAFEQCRALDPARAEALTGQAMALLSLGRPEDALAILAQANRSHPDHAPSWSLHATVLGGLGRTDEALPMYERAVALAPANAEDRLSLSHLYLGRMDFARGWPAYEARLERRGSGRLPTAKPRWNGSPDAGRLFVWAEQGLGDEVLYSTMFPDLFARMPGALVSADARLIPLFRRSFPGGVFVPRDQPPADDRFDVQLPAGSLGALLRPAADRFPAAGAPVLVADAGKVRQVRQFPAFRQRRVCGLSWNSVNAQVGADKSLPLIEMRELLMLDGFAFASLQYGEVSGEVAAACALTDASITRLPGLDLFADIDGLCALIDACDVVVTTSNSTAHLAGALGKRTLLLVPRFTGRMWYWNTRPGEAFPPWYPSVKVLRQDRQGDWSEPLRAAKAELEGLR